MTTEKPLMPRTVRTARALTFTAGALVLVAGLLYVGLALGDPDEVEREYNVRAEALAVLGVVFLAHGGAGVGLGLRYATGGARLRVAAIVWAGLGVVIGLGTVPLGLLVIALAVTVVVNLMRAPSRSWFERERG
ncbi:hypothetical protein [Streptomyces sp. 6N223]|uniref:hypothetical protein n=1 Tax=Streptomyces sp. 6N223 TaxID=3457412 RepID=UPI003FD19E5A